MGLWIQSVWSSTSAEPCWKRRFDKDCAEPRVPVYYSTQATWFAPLDLTCPYMSPIDLPFPCHCSTPSHHPTFHIFPPRCPGADTRSRTSDVSCPGGSDSPPPRCGWPCRPAAARARRGAWDVAPGPVDR